MDMCITRKRRRTPVHSILRITINRIPVRSDIHSYDMKFLHQFHTAKQFLLFSLATNFLARSIIICGLHIVAFVTDFVNRKAKINSKYPKSVTVIVTTLTMVKGCCPSGGTF
jgi:hypothetical protein